MNPKLTPSLENIESEIMADLLRPLSAAEIERLTVDAIVTHRRLIDDADRFWLSGNRGVHRVSRDELNAFLDGDARHVHGIGYARRDGLRNPEASGRTAARATDGRLWFPTYGGAAVVDPAFAVSLDSVPPIVRSIVPNRRAATGSPSTFERAGAAPTLT